MIGDCDEEGVFRSIAMYHFVQGSFCKRAASYRHPHLTLVRQAGPTWVNIHIIHEYGEYEYDPVFIFTFIRQDLFIFIFKSEYSLIRIHFGALAVSMTRRTSFCHCRSVCGCSPELTSSKRERRLKACIACVVKWSAQRVPCSIVYALRDCALLLACHEVKASL